jgi:hypothetical protein
MNIRLLSATAIIAVGFSTNAHALSISGWGFKIGSVVATIDLKGVPNPNTKPSIAVVDATLDEIETYCRNPQGFIVAPGVAGTRTVFGVNQVDGGEITGRGTATVEIEFIIDGTDSCLNNWHYIEGSAAAKQITATIEYFLCSGEDIQSPCFDATNNVLTVETKRSGFVTGVCALHPVLRDDYYLPREGQQYTCIETSSGKN